ncbi:hypothetical protein U9M48_007752 [Paspalum notatum var. saurae]|uniref:Uncharacterized protein n=1 Tax=Paspalum notatum var. saurae TaxID=547442 RepID=A0AAQ3WC23_PASNO
MAESHHNAGSSIGQHGLNGNIKAKLIGKRRKQPTRTGDRRPPRRSRSTQTTPPRRNRCATPVQSKQCFHQKDPQRQGGVVIDDASEEGSDAKEHRHHRLWQKPAEALAQTPPTSPEPETRPYPAITATQRPRPVRTATSHPESKNSQP